MTVLSLDLGTTATKAVVWGDGGPLAVGRATVSSSFPQPGWVEQDPRDWWAALVAACAEVPCESVDTVVFSSARETFVPVDGGGEALGPAIVWSDRRADDEAQALAQEHGGQEVLRQRLGVIVDGGCPAAKVRWLLGHEPALMSRARWVLSPRDYVVRRLTGVAVTDRTLASRTGWYELDGSQVSWAPADLMPAVVPSTSVVADGLLAESAAALGLGRHVAVVIGAGDRACEVLGSGAGDGAPMVSWGTTANVSVPVATPGTVPVGASCSASALGGFLLECGLSAAGAAMDWLSRVTGQPLATLVSLAEAAPAGAGGVLAAPWFNGARAPWWDASARAAFTGLRTTLSLGDLARSLYEGVAMDVARSLEALGVSPPRLAASGGGAESRVWPGVLAAVTGVVVERRRPELAASAGARFIAAAATGASLGLDDINPVTEQVEPDPSWVSVYRALRPEADAASTAVLGLGGRPTS